MLGGRAPKMVLREALRGRNYAALGRALYVYRRPHADIHRYLVGRGGWPYRCKLRTPNGTVAPLLFSHHDMWTVNEVFCRQDYAVGPELCTVVDIGSNIGVSALYFLTRNRSARAWLYEPVPRNVERLRDNLAGLEARYVLRQLAVAPVAGRASFGVEDTGRYGGIGVPTDRSIEVGCAGVNDVLEEALAEAPLIDVLKIDTEGTELELLSAMRPELLRRVRTVYAEVSCPPQLELKSFTSSFRNETLVLRNRDLRA